MTTRQRRIRIRRSISAGVLLATACATGGVRPRYGPEPQAVMLILDHSPDSVASLLAASLRSRGLTVRAVAPREGYVESNWFDLDRAVSTAPPFGRMDRIVKLRFFADPVAERTRLFAEFVIRSAWDPSVPPRELERMPRDAHPGRVLLDSVLTAVNAYVVRDTAKAGGPPLVERPAPDTAKARQRP